MVEFRKLGRAKSDRNLQVGWDLFICILKDFLSCTGKCAMRVVSILKRHFVSF